MNQEITNVFLFAVHKPNVVLILEYIYQPRSFSFMGSTIPNK